MTDLSKLLEERGGEVYDLHAKTINPQFVKVLRTIEFDRAYVRGEGHYLWDAEGRRYLDLIGGYGTFNIGRNHPKVKDAIRQVLDQNLPNLVKMDAARLSGFLAEALLERAPGYERVFFANSGAEAVEAAIKLTRAATNKPGILYWDHAFHGLTMGALSLNGNDEFRGPFGDLLPGCRSIPMGDLEALERELKKGDVGALFCEPIQGKGVYEPPEGFFKAAHALLKKHKALLVMDEVQTGLGRTGTFLCSQQLDVTPDIVMIAKALSGGMIPVGAVLTTAKVHGATFSRMDKCIVHGSTFYQGDLAMAAGLATLEVLDEEDLYQNATVMGERLRDGIEGLKQKHPLIKEVRGRGLLLAVEFGASGGLFGRMKQKLLDTVEKGLFTQTIVMTLLRDHGILSQVAGHKVDILKFLSPLTLKEEDVDAIVSALDQTLEAARVSGAMLAMAKNLGKQALLNR